MLNVFVYFYGPATIFKRKISHACARIENYKKDAKKDTTAKRSEVYQQEYEYVWCRISSLVWSWSGHNATRKSCRYFVGFLDCGVVCGVCSWDGLIEIEVSSV